MTTVASVQLTFLALTWISFAGCSDPTSEPIPTTLEVTPATVTITEGASQSLTARVLDQDGEVIPDVPIQFASGSVAIATVGASGVVTGVGPGTVGITVTALSLARTITVTVTELPPTPTSLVLTKTEIALIPGFSQTLGVIVLDEDDVQIPGLTPQFTSAHTSIATVSAVGVVTGESNGATSITVTVAGLAAVAQVAVDDLARIPLGGNPFGIDIAGNGVAYITQILGNGVARIDLPLLDSPRVLDLGFTPAHVAFAPDGSRAFVTMQSGQALAEINAATNTETRRLSLGDDGFNLVVSRDGATVYATTGGGMVHFVDAATLSIQRSIQLNPVTNGLAEHPTASLLYVSSRNGGDLTEINTTTGAAVRTFNLGGMPQRVVVTPDGNTAFVANEVNGVDVVDLVTGTVGPSIGILGDGLGLAITADGQSLYVSLPQAGMLKEIDVATRAVVTTYVVDGTPRNIAITDDGAIVMVPNEGGWVDVISR